MPIKTIHIDRMDQLSLILFDHPFDTTISRNRDLFLYRGLPDSTFSLITSLQRVCKHKQMSWSWTFWTILQSMQSL